MLWSRRACLVSLVKRARDSDCGTGAAKLINVVEQGRRKSSLLQILGFDA